MRVAIFCVSFPAISETFILRQITGLLDQGHDVEIFADTSDFTDGKNFEFDSYSLRERTTYMAIPGPKKRLLFGIPLAFLCFFLAPFVTTYALKRLFQPAAGPKIAVIFRLWRLLRYRGSPFDVVHCHQGYVGNNYLFLTRLWNSAFVVSFHGIDFSAFVCKYGENVYRELFEKMTLGTVNSNFTAQRVAALNCPTKKIIKLPVGLDPKIFTFQSRHRVAGETIHFLTVGRLTEKKGIEYSIKAFAKLHEKFPETDYWIIGDGPLRNQLEKLISQLNLNGIIQIFGAQNSTQVREIMQRAHIFVLSSVTSENGDTEGQGLVLQEAQSSGLPIIATNHNGFPESIIPGKSGYLVPERDIVSLTQTMEDLVLHPECWEEMGRFGRIYVEENFDISKLNIRLADIYNEALHNFTSGVK